eukprot:scaffold109257_cov34-Tisochrysis_lutea.AAC.4
MAPLANTKTVETSRWSRRLLPCEGATALPPTGASPSTTKSVSKSSEDGELSVPRGLPPTASPPLLVTAFPSSLLSVAEGVLCRSLDAAVSSAVHGPTR